MALAIHPIAELFPAMNEAAFAELKADIATRGVFEPVVLHEGKILDGRHRARASDELGKPYPTRAFDGTDALQFVVSMNLHRRHLDESQRAMVAARIANLGEGRPMETRQICPVSQAAAADMLSIGRTSVKHARKVLTSGSPSLIAAVERGEVSVSAAAKELRARVLKEIAEVQAEYAKAPRQRAEFERKYPHLVAHEKWRDAYWRAEYLEKAIKEAEQTRCPADQLIELQTLVSDIQQRLKRQEVSHGNESAARH